MLCSIGIDREGGFLNVNADDAAAGAATLSDRLSMRFFTHAEDRNRATFTA